MSNKIQRNAICPLCNSGLKYKHCCGKNQPNTGVSIEFISDKKEYETDFERTVYEKLGHYPDDYIDSIKDMGEVIYVLIDESNIDNYYAVGGIVVLKSEIERNKKVYNKLNEMLDNYNIDYVHFTDIFGRKNVLGERKKAFIQEYIDIVKEINMCPFSACMSEEEIKNYINVNSISKEQCYMVLTWIMMFNILNYVIHKYGVNIIIEMWRENENITNEKRILHQENIRGIIRKFPFAHISIYRHYALFMKQEILFSSLSDFVAYLAIGLYPKIKSGVSDNKLAKNYYYLLKIFNGIFKDSTGMRNEGLNNLLQIAKEKENYPNMQGS